MTWSSSTGPSAANRGCFAALIAAVPDGDTRRARRLAAHLRWYRLGLHNHHQGEDELIWPLLLARVDLQADVVRRMEAQHSAGLARRAHGTLRARCSARCLMVRSIFRSITHDPGSMTGYASLSLSGNAEVSKRLRLISLVCPRLAAARTTTPRPGCWTG